MARTPLTTLVKVTLLLALLSTVTGKSVSKRNAETDKENEVENVEVKVSKETEPILKHPVEDKKEKEVEKIPEKKEEEIGEKTSEKPPISEEKGHEKPANETEGHKAIDPTASIDTSDSTRSSRNTGRQPETPATLIENFRNKLKAARSNLEESIAARRSSEPRRFLLTPTPDKPQPAPSPTVDTIAKTTQEAPTPGATPAEDTTNVKKIITSPVVDEGSLSSEEQKPEVRENSEASEDITHLLHVREEINKIRHMMQALREHQLRQQFGAQFPHSRNLTEEETQHLATLIDKLKDQGKISTNPNAQIVEETDFQNHPPETTKLIEDIKRLKQSVMTFAKQVGPKGNIEDLEKQIQQQKEEIDNLKRLVDDLQPPRQFPSNPVMIKHPQNVKSDLHHELRSLQDILNELLTKDEQKTLRSSEPQKDEEIGTLMHIFRSMAHPGGKQTIETKLEKLERDLKDMESEHHRTRQELLLQRLQHDVKSMKTSSKFNPEEVEDAKDKARGLEDGKTLKKTDVMSAKITALEDKLKQMETGESRSLDLPSDIEKELDKLQREINLMTLKNLEKNKSAPMSSRQLESLFAEILNPPVEDSSHATSIGKLVKIPEKTIDITHDIHSHALPDSTSQTGYGQPPIFQLPFCLQKNPHSHPQYHPYPPSIPSSPVAIDTTDYKHKQPITIQHVPSGGYGQYPAKEETNHYQQPIKTQNQPHYPAKSIVETTEYHQPIKYPAKGEANQYQQPIKIQNQAHYPAKHIAETNDYQPIKYPAKGEASQYQQPIKIQNQPHYPAKSIAETNDYQPIKYPAKQGIEASQYQQPIKTHPAQAIVETNEYHQPVKSGDYGQHPVETNEYHQAVKPSQTYAAQQTKGYEETIKNEGYTQPQQGYNNEEQYTIKNQNTEYNNAQKYNKETPIIHHVYQPSVPKATPVKIEYHPALETEEHQEYDTPYQPYKPTCQHHANIQEEMNHLNSMIGDLDEKIDLEPNYDLYRTKNYKPRSKRSVDYDYDKNKLYKDIKQRLATLREAVQSVQDNQSLPNTPENNLFTDFQRSAYAPDNYQPYDVKDSYATKIRKKQKFDDLFIKIVKFILHKLEISAPYVVESLFNGEAFEYDYEGYNNGYRSSKGRSASEEAGEYNNVSEEGTIQKTFDLPGLFNNFQGFHGLLGFIPTILFKLLSNFSSFLSLLKRNNFFKNFLFPGALILAVDGIMAILVWWFSTDENHNALSFLNNDGNRQY